MDNKAKLAERREESEAIQVANDLYSKHDEHSAAATAEYRLRVDRLKEVLKDMKELARVIAVQN
jgi:hypothetical protein